jgi:nitrous oxidase accessory protein NosD
MLRRCSSWRDFPATPAPRRSPLRLGKRCAVVEHAQDGDVIELAPGDYRGRLRIERPVSLVAKSGATVIGDGEEASSPLTRPT